MTLKKYPDIERLGHEDNKDIFLSGEDTLVVEEKVDGGNGSFWQEDDGIHFGSRNRDLTLENDTKMFAGFQKQLREHLESLEKEGVKINPDYIYYFEWMAKHTISYTQVPFVIGFDIRMKRSANSEGEGLFIGRDARDQEFKRLKIESVPLVWRGKVNDFRTLEIRELIPKSKYYDGFAEGIVIKNYCRKHPFYNHQIYAKLVRDEFKEDNKAVFGNVRNKSSDTSKIVEEFCTDARIRKAVLYFIDNGEKLELKLMSKVPHYVIRDIFKEEILTIIDKYKFIDLKEMKQKVPKLCLRVINEMMLEKSVDSVLNESGEKQ
jgi:hypothetical protein